MDVYLGIGSNAGHLQLSREALLSKAVNALASLGDIQAVSPVYESEAWPDPRDPRYLNAVVYLKTGLAPEALLAGCLAIEAGFGRIRSSLPSERYAPRSLDIDVLAIGETVVKTDDLEVPHPRMLERAFVMAPLAEIAPNWRHPMTGERAVDVCQRLGQSGLQRLDLNLGNP